MEGVVDLDGLPVRLAASYLGGWDHANIDNDLIDTILEMIRNREDGYLHAADNAFPDWKEYNQSAVSAGGMAEMRNGDRTSTSMTRTSWCATIVPQSAAITDRSINTRCGFART